MSKPKVVATIEARMASTRLPGKVLRPLAGRPMLALMIERLLRAPEVDQVVVATTVDPACDPIAALAGELGVGCFRGSEDDVLLRVLEAARHFGADLIAETTGDCPLIDPAAAGRTIRAAIAGGWDFCSNQRAYPRGLDVRVFPTAVLAEVNRLTSDQADHEHVSIYIKDHPERYRVHWLPPELPPEVLALRLTVDTPEDFALVSRVFEALYPANPAFGLAEVAAYLAAHPEVAALNRAVEQKAAR